MKRYIVRNKLKTWVKVVMALMIVADLLMIVEIIDRDFVKNCKSAGYSEAYCIAHK